MLLEYLKNNYAVNEPIFVCDIETTYKSSTLRQQLKRLCDAGKIQRYAKGIYYLSSNSILKNANTLSIDEVIKKKYLYEYGKIIGYYSGYTFANEIGVSNQVPTIREIVSNKASSRRKEIIINNQKIIIRKGRTKITEENYLFLQFLDFVKDYEKYKDEEVSDYENKVKDYIKANKIKKESIDKYIKKYPNTLYKTIYEMRLYEVFA